MRILISFIVFHIATASLAQSVETKNSRFLTYEQNEDWLKNTKAFDTGGKWKAVRQRFFLEENRNTSADSIQYSPLIVINGVPLNIPNKSTDSSEVLNLLNEDSIEQIDILDKLTDEWIFCKPFSGVIILTVDKKAAKKLFKQKLE